MNSTRSGLLFNLLPVKIRPLIGSSIAMPIKTKITTDLGEVEKAPVCEGQGTEEDPFIVEFQKDDPGNPMNWGSFRKWSITFIATMSVFAITLTSSAYSASSSEIFEDFDISTEVFTLGLSLFILGFAIGPALWGPL